MELQKGRGHGRTPVRDRVRLRGMFADGIWHCSCNPPLPAQRFQTKNGGVNHGRWFYTCQKSQPQRCGFFLWQDEAKPREAKALFDNSHSESRTTSATFSPRTPGKANQTSISPSKAPATDDIDWPDSDDEEEMLRAADRASRSLQPPETPRKQLKRDGQSSPRATVSRLLMTPSPKKDEIFLTPATRGKDETVLAPGLMTPNETPAAIRFRPALAQEPPPFKLSQSPQKDSGLRDFEMSSDLIRGLLELDIELNEDAVAFIETMCERQVRQVRGIEKGRDVARAVVKERDARIVELEKRVAELETERKAVN